ncbi:hypothetical protein GF376_02820 [Candidatus Peregrinibacteria bacterium]|nr:hypothetical protein [Candidatus Peregrinibacteria bacterium]
MLKGTLSKAKKALTVAAGSTLFGASVFAQANSGFITQTDNPGRISSATQGQGSARLLLLDIVNYFLGFLGLVAVLMVIYGGILVLTSAGDPEKAGKGKKILLFAVIGIVIILLSFAFVNTVLGAGTGTEA